MNSARKDRPVTARTLLGAATLGACVLTLSCFEPPVSEEVEIRFFAPRGVLFTSTIEIHGSTESSNDSKANPLVLERVEQVRRDLATGQDPWSRRIDSIGAPGERIVMDRDKKAALSFLASVVLAKIECAERGRMKSVFDSGGGAPPMKGR